MNEKERWALVDAHGNVIEYTLADKASDTLLAFERQVGSESAARELYVRGFLLVLVRTEHTILADTRA